MKRLFTGCAALVLLLGLSVHAFALQVPTETTVRNLDGVQECIKVFQLDPEADAAGLIEEPFEYNGFLYSYSGMVKSENPVGETKSHRETISVETEKKDLDVILAALEPSMPYDDGTFHGVLNLDHTSIKTEAAEYKSGSYAVTDVKEIGGLSSNDMSFVPSTTVKNGITLKLSNVDWRVQSTDLVGDVLVPASYTAVATYSGTAWYNTPSKYVTIAEYVGEVSSSRIGSITYTLTYVGTVVVPETPAPTPTLEPAANTTETLRAVSSEEAQDPFQKSNSEGFVLPAWVWITGGVLILLAAAVTVLLVIIIRKQGAHSVQYGSTEERDYDE